VTVDSDLSSPLHALSDVLKLVMNLQQIAGHPQLVESSAVLSPFHMDGMQYHTAGLVDSIFDHSNHDVSD